MRGVKRVNVFECVGCGTLEKPDDDTTPPEGWIVISWSQVGGPGKGKLLACMVPCASKALEGDIVDKYEGDKA